jgi:hypothetical protein
MTPGCNREPWRSDVVEVAAGYDAVDDPVDEPLDEPVPMWGQFEEFFGGVVVEPLGGVVVEPLGGVVVEPLAGVVVEPLAGVVVEPLEAVVDAGVTTLDPLVAASATAVPPPTRTPASPTAANAWRGRIFIPITSSWRSSRPEKRPPSGDDGTETGGSGAVTCALSF